MDFAAPAGSTTAAPDLGAADASPDLFALVRVIAQAPAAFLAADLECDLARLAAGLPRPLPAGSGSALVCAAGSELILRVFIAVAAELLSVDVPAEDLLNTLASVRRDRGMAPAIGLAAVVARAIADLEVRGAICPVGPYLFAALAAALQPTEGSPRLK